jgi:hypothetical protein
MERRIRGRAQSLPDEPWRLPWELSRFRQLTELQKQAAGRGDMGILIDTTHLDVDPEQVWQDVLQAQAAIRSSKSLCMRVVLDANVLNSALIPQRGAPARILEAGKMHASIWLSTLPMKLISSRWIPAIIVTWNAL